MYLSMLALPDRMGNYSSISVGSGDRAGLLCEDVIVFKMLLDKRQKLDLFSFFRNRYKFTVLYCYSRQRNY